MISSVLAIAFRRLLFQRGEIWMLHTRSNSRLDLPAALFAVMVMGAVALYLFNPSTLAAADPVVVAAGDIACDPASSGFNGGYGTSVCHQLATYRLITAIAPAA